MIAPGQTLGLLGGGPLGRLLAQAAQTLGYRVHLFEPQAGSPASAVTNRETNASYADLPALRRFAAGVDLVTGTFENLPRESLDAIASLAPLQPGVEALHLCQNRHRTKAWLQANGFPQVRHAEALDGDIAAAVAQVGRPCLVKTADFGYDGRGQMRITSDAELEQAAAIFRGRRCVVERWVDFTRELAVIVARSATGQMRTLPVAENVHARYVLDLAIVPARIGAAVTSEVAILAQAIAERLDVVGLLAVEMFLTDRGEVLVNELAPRPHDSGLGSIDAGETSQFEQHVRAVCGLPLGPAGVRDPAVTVSLFGDVWKWRDGRVASDPNWSAILREPLAKLHLYGEPEPRLGRKMGHFTVRAAAIETALERARELKASL